MIREAWAIFKNIFTFKRKGQRRDETVEREEKSTRRTDETPPCGATKSGNHESFISFLHLCRCRPRGFPQHSVLISDPVETSSFSDKRPGHLTRPENPISFKSRWKEKKPRFFSVAETVESVAQDWPDQFQRIQISQLMSWSDEPLNEVVVVQLFPNLIPAPKMKGNIPTSETMLFSGRYG